MILTCETLGYFDWLNAALLILELNSSQLEHPSIDACRCDIMFTV